MGKKAQNFGKSPKNQGFRGCSTVPPFQEHPVYRYKYLYGMLCVACCLCCICLLATHNSKLEVVLVVLIFHKTFQLFDILHANLVYLADVGFDLYTGEGIVSGHALQGVQLLGVVQTVSVDPGYTQVSGLNSDSRHSARCGYTLYLKPAPSCRNLL